MQKVLRMRVLLVVAAGLAGWGVSGCGSSQVAESPGPAHGSLSAAASSMISPGVLDRAGLKTVWQQTLPLKKGEKFAAIVLQGDRLCLRSDRNYLWSLDRVGGEVVFSRSVAPPGIPVLGLVTYGNSLISVIGNKLVELDRDTGQDQRVSDLGLSIVAPPARNSQFFYISAADHRLHVFRAADLVQTFPVTADNDSLITTIVAEETFVAFGTNAGNLVGMIPDAPKRLWQFKAPEAVAGPVIYDGVSFYFASVDTNVYRVDVAAGTKATLTWKHQTEAVLDRAPRVTNDFVYQYAVGRGLTAMAKPTGQAVWSLPEGVDLLAESNGRAYVITKFHTLAVMDNAAGKELFSANFAPVTDHAANTADAKIYLMDETGRVTCLEPIR
jgi:outer membrane protein assembly factor BamB